MGLDCSQVSGEDVFTSHHMGHMTGMAGHCWRPKKEGPAALFMEQKFSNGHALSAHDGSVRGGLGWVGSRVILLQHWGFRDNISPSMHRPHSYTLIMDFCAFIALPKECDHVSNL